MTTLDRFAHLSAPRQALVRLTQSVYFGRKNRRVERIEVRAGIPRRAVIEHRLTEARS
jgi:hypothetical protein